MADEAEMWPILLILEPGCRDTSTAGINLSGRDTFLRLQAF